MKPYQIHLDDWKRILLGEVPGGFYLEVIIRTLFIYLLLMVAMRLMGKRMASHLSRNELIAMVSLAAAIGVPLMTPDRGLLPAVVIAVIVVLIQRLISYLDTKSEKIEALTQDKLSILVSDGKMDLAKMRNTRISRERLFAQLRANSISSLGQVKRLYLEAGGAFSVIKEKEVRPGLSVLPQYDAEFQANQRKSEEVMVCNECGNQRKVPFDKFEKCERCHTAQWKAAYF